MGTHLFSSNEFFSAANRLSIKKITALIVLILCLGITPAWGAKPVTKLVATLYVNASAEGNNDGTSWSNAFTDLQDALAAAVSGDQIWVATGTYKPTTGSNRSVSFNLKSGVKIYGSFAGGETRLNERQLDPSLTVLSGDIGTIGDDTDNSNHVVYADGVTGAVLDGFTVTRGRGDSASRGAGMYNKDSTLIVANCIFSYNKVGVNDGTYDGTLGGKGAGMYNKNSAPIVTNCTFINNQAGNRSYNSMGSGGGMYNEGYYETADGSLSPVITGCTFSDNVASSKSIALDGGGGGMYNVDCSPTIDRCTFERNLAGLGGGMLNLSAQPTITNCIFNTNSNGEYPDGLGGAIYNVANATIINCTFYQNGWTQLPWGSPRFRPYTSQGGAIYDYRAGSTITNCIFSKNAVKGWGGAIFSDATRPDTTLTNCLFNENISWWPGNDDNGDPIINHVGDNGNVQYTNNLYDIDPLLVDPVGGDFHLLYDSPCIDAGYSFYRGYLPYTEPFGIPTTDFEGDKRIVDGDGDGVPAVDIGVDEFIPNLPDLQAFLQALADSGDLDEATAALLLAYVDDAQAALDQNKKKTAVSILNKLIADAGASLGDTETAQLIAMKTGAVIDIL